MSDLPEKSDIIKIPRLDVLGAKLNAGWYIGREDIIGELHAMMSALTGNLCVACGQINAALLK